MPKHCCCSVLLVHETCTNLVSRLNVVSIA
jgi:hypothetical protein